MTSPYLLSVIIPCYNCQDYVYECLESVCCQIDNSVEIIVINDGSTDNSFKEIERFVSNNTNKIIKLITQQNMGVSAARNTGIDVSSGKYLAFLDGDDLWDTSFWEKISPILQSDNIDLIEFNANRFYNGNKNEITPVSIVSKNESLTINSLSDLRETFLNNEWFPWARIYKRFIFNTLRFPVGRHYEDIALVPKTYLASKTIKRMTDVLVLYRVRSDSITNAPKKEDIDDIIYALGVLNGLAKKKCETEIKTIAPSIHLTYSLARRVSTSVYGYCFFNNRQIQAIKAAVSPFLSTQKPSRKIKFYFIREYCLIKKVKYKLRTFRSNA
ncbi:glycosyltransferase [Citrobacter portucalensis]|uniref:glycosyltransferase n=1 Tax=Citrobacter TaxID=544 RepID=UPI002575D63D|nr:MULTISPECIES: glycosyltransferase [unclassified Citrobacter]MBJ9339911.1 glycosyltransferase [Citrobacter freundii]MDM2786698.1 glycosyltransferase [Citrobacter sp. Cpo113]MDM2807985.1 glycosyltransferase [Citrobacter sp. Cpo107]